MLSRSLIHYSAIYVSYCTPYAPIHRLAGRSNARSNTATTLQRPFSPTLNAGTIRHYTRHSTAATARSKTLLPIRDLNIDNLSVFLAVLSPLFSLFAPYCKDRCHSSRYEKTDSQRRRQRPSTSSKTPNHSEPSQDLSKRV